MTKKLTESIETGEVLHEETYSYDAAGNVVSCTVGFGSDSFVYDANNRLTEYNGFGVEYDLDGNMTSAILSGVEMGFVYDSANRLINTDSHSYTYNVDNVRIRNYCEGSDTSYVYDTHAKLSRLLVKTTNGVVTKYVYGRGLIGEETGGAFKTYHFDYRGSTVAITDASGSVTDTFEYDAYGTLTGRTGMTDTPFIYDGRDGVVTDENGLLYMRARYYSPELRRFINADIMAGNISNAITLNRYAYANGNPVSNIDPFGLSAISRNLNCSDQEIRDWSAKMGLPTNNQKANSTPIIKPNVNKNAKTSTISSTSTTILESTAKPQSKFPPVEELFAAQNSSSKSNVYWEELYEYYGYATTATDVFVNEDLLEVFEKGFKHKVSNSQRPNNISMRAWKKQKDADLRWAENMLGSSSSLAKAIDDFSRITDGISLVTDIGIDLYNNQVNDEPFKYFLYDAAVDIVFFAGGELLSAGGGKLVGAFGSAIGGPVGLVVGTFLGGALTDLAYTYLTQYQTYDGKTAIEWAKDSYR